MHNVRATVRGPMALLVAAVALAGSVRAVEAGAAKVEPELAADTELLAKIAALPDNTWMKLPRAKTVGDMGVLNGDPDYKRDGPRVRDYCNKMVWAPERKRALYCGGGHNIHPYNDVWEFDLAANTWACLYGADPPPPRTKPGEEDKAVAWYKEHAAFANGAVRAARGGPLRPCHTWWSLAYDSDRKLMLFLESHKGFFGADKACLAKALDLDPKDPLFRTYGSGPGEAWLFAFDVAAREWKDVLTGVPKACESLCLEYLPDRHLVWWLSDKTYTRAPNAREWAAYPGPKGGPGGGGETAYDPEKRLRRHLEEGAHFFALFALGLLEAQAVARDCRHAEAALDRTSERIGKEGECDGLLGLDGVPEGFREPLPQDCRGIDIGPERCHLVRGIRPLREEVLERLRCGREVERRDACHDIARDKFDALREGGARVLRARDDREDFLAARLVQ